jgi:integrase
MMNQAGLSSRAAADQLGHANISMTSYVYFGENVLVTGAATVLQVLGT